MATIITPLAPEFQINVDSGGGNGTSGSQDLANLAVLSDGRFVAVYQSDYFGSATDTDPIAAIFNLNGTTSLSYRDTYNASALQKVPAVAGRLGGGFGVVFQNDRHANNSPDALGPNITYSPVSAANAVLAPIAVADFNSGAGHDALQNPAIATLSSGRQVVAFERIWTAGTDHDVFVNVVNAAGTTTQFSAANPLDVVANGSWQANPSVGAIGNQALIVFEDGSATTTASANIRARIFSGDTNTLGTAFTIADHTARLRTADVAAIDDHRYAIVYGDQNDVWVRILNSTTGALSPEVQMDVSGGFSLNPAIAGLPGGGFVATWAEWNGSDYDVRARVFTNTGAPQGADFLVTSLSDSSQFTPDVTVSGSRVFFAWTDFAARPEDGVASGIRGRFFGLSELPNAFNGDGDSIVLQNDSGLPKIWTMDGTMMTGETVLVDIGPTWHVAARADFSGDGKSDILWQNDSGLPAIWTMNGSTPTAYAYLPDVGPTWHIAAAADFNGDGKADILWQNDTGRAVIWTMNGSTVTASAYLPDLGPTWHVAAAADFNGDGKADILWQNDTGLPAIWTMNGSTPTAYAYLPDVGHTWHVASADDFNGDGKADILWQKDSGLPAIWTMNGSSPTAYAYLPDVGPTSHVAETADFNEDGKADILWQSDSGLPTLWTMDGATITSTAILPNPGSDWNLF